MIQDNDPVVGQFISVPRELSSLSCAAFTAGVVDAILERAQFVRAHGHPDAEDGRG
jgi:trafficking protein particle complex subunit 5